MEMIRLDRFLTQAGVGTRSEVKKYLKNGMVQVNGETVKKPEQKIDSEKDQITYQGKLLQYESFVALMLHKPGGCITATSDRLQKTVLDYIDHPRKEELFPVGRLDIDTEGLVILMNDGDLAHRMLSPKYHVEKTYFVRVNGSLSEEDVTAFAEGMEIGEKKPTLPARLHILKSGEISEAEVTLREGKFHQIKRMFAARGGQVLYLKRISMAGIALDEALAPGMWRELTQDEKDKLLQP
jgi:16S rRNA pseudouridine516 synthase